MLAFLLPPMLVASDPVRKPLPRLVAFLLLLSLVLATLACSEAEGLMGNRPGRSVLNGELHIVGSRSMAQPVAAWVMIFRREHPGVRVLTHFDGSGAAAGAMASGEADIAPMTRLMRAGESEFVALSGASVDPIRIGQRGDAADGDDGSHALYIYVADSRSGRSSAVEFARIALSGEGQAELARAGYRPLTRRSRSEMKLEIERLSEGEGVL